MSNKIDDALKDSSYLENMRKKGYVPCPVTLLKSYPELSDGAILCYIHLMRYAILSIEHGNTFENGTPFIFPSKDKLSADMNRSTRRITAYLSELEGVGLCARQMRGQGRTDTITVYLPDRALIRAESTYSAKNDRPKNVLS